MNFLRLDVDASFPECSEFFGVGGVLRNHDDNLVAAFGRTFPKTDSIVLGELLAIIEGLLIVRDKGFLNVIMYSYSLLSVQAVTKPLDNQTYVGSCALDIQYFSSELDIVAIKHVKRTTNEVANSLAFFVVFPHAFLLGVWEFPILAG